MFVNDDKYQFHWLLPPKRLWYVQWLNIAVDPIKEYPPWYQPKTPPLNNLFPIATLLGQGRN